MADAGDEQRVEHAAGERIALAGDEGRSDRAGVAGNRRADAGIDAVADRFDRGGEFEPPTPPRGIVEPPNRWLSVMSVRRVQKRMTESPECFAVAGDSVRRKEFPS